jgi:hypothetical protein
MTRAVASELGDAKRALHQFADALAARPVVQRDKTAQDFGELFLTLLKLADRLDVDLIKAAEDLIEQRAANSPTLVPSTLPGRPGKPRHGR